MPIVEVFRAVDAYALGDQVGNVFAVPGQIDLDRFQAAVQAAVARNRPAAGRLKREGDNWNVSRLPDRPRRPC